MLRKGHKSAGNINESLMKMETALRRRGDTVSNDADSLRSGQRGASLRRLSVYGRLAVICVPCRQQSGRRENSGTAISDLRRGREPRICMIAAQGVLSL